jgi:hypothetical protein
MTRLLRQLPDTPDRQAGMTASLSYVTLLMSNHQPYRFKSEWQGKNNS